MPVPVHVAHADDVPGGTGIDVDEVHRKNSCTACAAHLPDTTAPLSFWNTTSDLWSARPSMSAMPFTCQDGSTVGSAATVVYVKVPDATVRPTHIANAPLSFCHGC